MRAAARRATPSSIHRCRLIIRAARWRREYISDLTAVYILAAVAGVAAGTGAWLLKSMIGCVSRFVGSLTLHTAAHWALLVIPAVGILLTGIYVRYILRDNIEHGVSRLVTDLRRHAYRLRAHLMYAPMIASTLTLGFGGSAGAEGPIAYTGAAIGSNLARLGRFSPDMMRVLLACGAGAGIAGIFKSPIGGFLFTLEVLRVQLDSRSVMAVLLAALMAGMTSFALSGFTPDLLFEGTHRFVPQHVLWYCALGLFCGLYSIYYSTVMSRMQRVYDSIANPWMCNLTGGIILGVALFLFPVLYGEGYGNIAHILGGDHGRVELASPLTPLLHGPWGIIIAAAIVLLLKSFAASASNSSGGVAGDFAPTLFAGCMAGLLFWQFSDMMGAGLSAPAFIFAGMGGVMAGAVRAPLMALFLTVEMTGCYSLFLPVMIVCGISFGVVRLYTTEDYWTMYLRRGAR